LFSIHPWNLYRISMPPRGGLPLPLSRPFARSSRGSTWSLQDSRRRRSGSGSCTLSWIRRPLPRRDRSYANIGVSARDIRAAIPPAQAVASERYRGLEAASLLALELGKAGEQADDFQALFGSGAQIAADITARSWWAAESKTRDLYTGKTGRHMPASNGTGTNWSSGLKSDIFNGVRDATRERLDAFVRLNESAFTDVPRLYADSAFQPAYALTFSASGQAALAQKKTQIDEYITKVRHFQFPRGGDPDDLC